MVNLKLGTRHRVQGVWFGDPQRCPHPFFCCATLRVTRTSRKQTPLRKGKLPLHSISGKCPIRKEPLTQSPRQKLRTRMTQNKLENMSVYP
ncbi:rCG36177 [Rattus norvegicus]|uniref:RCG36177 n=1 Tax=Rattus norvegicus TaxID=10116 RepID=A6IK53_RAT|nr:rCG36177 [Rattus norvegicus]